MTLHETDNFATVVGLFIMINTFYTLVQIVEVYIVPMTKQCCNNTVIIHMDTDKKQISVYYLTLES